MELLIGRRGSSQLSMISCSSASMSYSLRMIRVKLFGRALTLPPRFDPAAMARSACFGVVMPF